MKRKYNILVFPAGTEIGLEIHASLSLCKDINLYGAGEDSSNPGRFVFNNYFVLPNINESFVSPLASLCHELEIDYIFPAHDDAIVALSQYSSEIPANIVGPDFLTAKILRSKSSTYNELSGIIRVPTTYSLGDKIDFPIIVKPDKGQGSEGVHLATSESELIFYLGATNNPIICEYLPGEEYTIDCFSDIEDGLLFCGPRARLRMRNGIAVHTERRHLPEAHKIAKLISSHFSLRGAWFFQLKRSSNDELVLLEVAPRIAGSMCTHRVAGVNFPLLSIYEREREPVVIYPLSSHVEVYRKLASSYRCSIYYESLYVDLDDTVIIEGAVNPSIISLIYKCINKGIPVVLITRHKGDLNATLSRHRLCGLFDEVIHVPTSESKSKYVTLPKPVLIDDSFSERFEVGSSLNIPVLDLTMIDLLH